MNIRRGHTLYSADYMSGRAEVTDVSVQY